MESRKLPSSSRSGAASVHSHNGDLEGLPRCRLGGLPRCNGDLGGLPRYNGDLDGLPEELLNLVFDCLVQSRRLTADGCCRNAERCCRTPGTSCPSLHGPLQGRSSGTREASSLLLTSKALSSAVKALPSFKALIVSHSMVSPSSCMVSPRRSYPQGSGLNVMGPNVLLVSEQTAGWVRSLYLREVPEPPAEREAAMPPGDDLSSSRSLLTHHAERPSNELPTSRALRLHSFQRLLVLHLPHWFGDQDAPALAPLGCLRSLCLRGSCVSDRGLRHVSLLTSLEELDLSSTDVSDRGIAHLVLLKRLRLLNLSFCHSITGSNSSSSSSSNSNSTVGDRMEGRGSYLHRLHSLQELFLCGTAVTDETLTLLSGLGSLRKLGLEQCENISDEGLDVVERFLARNHTNRLRSNALSGWGRSFMEVTASVVLCG